MKRPKKVIVATSHQEYVEEQRDLMDAYMEEYGVYTRTAVVDEALYEFFARRTVGGRKVEWPRSYGQKSGLKQSNDFPRRRATDLIAAGE